MKRFFAPDAFSAQGSDRLAGVVLDNPAEFWTLLRRTREFRGG